MSLLNDRGDQRPPRSTLLEIARAWLVIGATSIGGGPSALYLMRRELVEKRKWLTQREFLEDWALSKLSLGINQIALTGFQGVRMAGAAGALVAIAAYLIPSGAITAAMTAGYTVVRDEALVRAALAGAGPVTAGLTIAVGITFAQGSMRHGWRAWVDRAYWIGAALVGLFLAVTPIAVILTRAVVGVIALRGEPQRASAEPEG